MIGKRLGHYRIVERIGAGGMGEVYRAEDEHLHRDVALKVLPATFVANAESLRALRNEANALSKLNHPNIATVHDFDMQEGTHFLVMEYVAGQTLAQRILRGPLDGEHVAALGKQIASALEEAHGRGIVHRDLKPSNILLTQKEQVKVLDFGLAKLARPSADLAVTQSQAEAHGISGTLLYMSPEQMRDDPVDARSDLYSFGAVLFEMATGQRPFEESLATRLTEAVLHRAPPAPRSLNPNLSPELERIILKCLEKNPEDRYQSAKDLEIDLRRLAGGHITQTVPATSIVVRPRRRVAPWAYAVVAAVAGILLLMNSESIRQRLAGGKARGRIDSLAVLPLENFSGEPSQDYFADGMTEELIADLSKISALKVISRTSVMGYKGTKKPLPQIARELNVAGVVEGSVLKAEGRVRITAQLIEAATERHVWASSYERDLKDVLALQEEVARAIAQEIKIRLNPDESTRLAANRAVNPGAHEAYLKGLYFWNQRSEESVQKGLGYFQEAIRLDPGYPLAYVGLADSYVVLATDQWIPAAEAFPRAREAALKALELDGALAEAHVPLAEMATAQWSWEEAEREYKRALELNPNYAVARQWYSAFLVKMARRDEAVAQARRAVELDPLSPIINVNEAQVLYVARRYDEARQAVLRTLELAPDFFAARYYLGLIDLQTGKPQEGITELKKAAELASGNELVSGALGYAYGRTGRTAEAQKILQELLTRSKNGHPSSYVIANICAGLGNKDEAVGWLEKAVEERESAVPEIGGEPMFDLLRLDSRFQELLKRIKLPTNA